MVNTKALKIRMIECDVSYKDLGEAIGCAENTARQKVNNIRPFSLEQAEKAQKRLDIVDNLFGYYFFNSESQNETDV